MFAQTHSRSTHAHARKHVRAQENISIFFIYLYSNNNITHNRTVDHKLTSVLHIVCITLNMSYEISNLAIATTITFHNHLVF